MSVEQTLANNGQFDEIFMEEDDALAAFKAWGGDSHQWEAFYAGYLARGNDEAKALFYSRQGVY